MLDHHLQRNIVYHLGFLSEARFSELKPDDIENKLFTYHLQKVVKAGYVEKTGEGSYRLTAEGRRLGFQAIRSEHFMLDKAYSTLFLIVRRATDGAWLLAERKVHPLIGYTTFPVATPVSDKHAEVTASYDLHAKTGLQGDFQALGSGYFHIYRGTELESFTNFTLLVCENASGTLLQQDPNAVYNWHDDIEGADRRMLPDMPILIEKYHSGQPFFIEQTLYIGETV